jgi:tetratricopeptide (TPR) repeat protein
MPFAQRQEGLKRWGFTCRCSLCSLPEEERSESDARRNRISEAEPELRSLWREGKHQAAIRVGEEMVELMKQEHLTPMLTDEYVILAKLYLARGDREMAQEYVEMALDILENLGFLGQEKAEDWNLERLLGVFSDRGIYQSYEKDEN